jgi:hypothetical protein
MEDGHCIDDHRVYLCGLRGSGSPGCGGASHDGDFGDAADAHLGKADTESKAKPVG